MAIYFVPGLSEERLDEYIRRLAPHQRNFLTRNGLGHMLGDRFMRVMVGENRWRRQQATTLVGNTIEHPNTHALVPAPTATATINSPRAIGFDATARQQPPGVVELTVPATTTSTSRSMLRIEGESSDHDDDGDDNTRDNEDDAGGDLIMEAIGDVMWEYARWAGSAAFLVTNDYVIEPALTVSGSMGLGVSFLSLGAGIWQYNRPIQSTSSQSSSYFTSAPFLIGSGIMGGVAAGTMIYARTAIRRFIQGEPLLPPAITKTTKNPQPPKKRGGRDN